MDDSKNGFRTDAIHPFFYSRASSSSRRSCMARRAYVSKYITKQLADLAKSKHLYFCSQGLKKPDLVFDEDGVPFPFEQAEHEDEYCRISWATGEQLIGTMLPEWYDEWASDVRDPEQLPAGMTRAQLEQYIFEPLTGEQLSLLESAEQVPVPWDM